MTTRWSPDTCSCVIEYRHDPSDDSLTVGAVIASCAKHQGDPDQVLKAVLAHNRHKNAVGVWLASNLQDAGNAAVGYDPHTNPDSDPVHVTNHGLDASARTALQGKADASFGPGRIRIV